MPKKRIAATAALLLLLVIVGPPIPSASPDRLGLYAVPRQAALDSGALDRAGGTIRQELASGWIVAAHAKAAAAWSKAGIVHRLLDPDARGKSYFLVHITGEPVPEALPLVWVEEAIYLYDGDPALLEALLSKPFALKALPERVRTLPREALALTPRRREPTNEIQAMAEMVSRDSLRGFIGDLQNFQTRRAETAGCQAAGSYIAATLANWGIQTLSDPFTFRVTYTGHNIIGTLPGKTSPQYVILLCAHYDSTSNQAWTLAPGADDNASGTAAVMEAARILRSHEFDFTLKFALFSAEELGLLGSQNYADKVAAAGEKIVAVLNLDMIAYTDFLPEDLDIIANPDSEWLANRFQVATQLYAPMPLKKVVDSSMTWSDHSSFWDNGYAAICGIEDADPPNPYYHRTGDTLDTLNLDFAQAVTKATLAVAAEMAQPLSYPRPPSSITCTSQVYASLFSATKTAHLAWQASLDPVAGYHVYRTQNLAQSMQKITTTPITQLSYVDRFLDPDLLYYYAVTAIDSQGRESHYSAVVLDNANNN